MVETWKPVVGFEEVYEVSTYGRVRRVGSGCGAVIGRILRHCLCLDTWGYHPVRLHDKGKKRQTTVHRLVAEAFLPPPAKETVNHIDGVKTNNHISNLEWATQQEQHDHAARMGLMKRAKGERNGLAKLTNEKVKFSD